MAEKYTILVPVDDNEERARQQATFVKGLPSAAEEIHVTVVHALHGEEREDPRNTADRVASVQEAVGILEDAGIECDTTDVGLPPADGIIDWADDQDVDLIVLGGRKRSPAGKVLFGSVTQEVLLNTDRPVTVTGGGSD